jgi:5-methylcytosine-specific restriction endonuclease McrA
MKQTALKADPEKTRAWVDRSRRSNTSMQKRRPISPASKAQRLKIVEEAPLCVYCGKPGTVPCHLASRAHGGCDDPRCTIGLCVSCHDRFDGRAPRNGFDLAPVLALPEFASERAHMAEHMSLPECLRRLTGEPWVPVSAKVQMDDGVFI